MTEQPKSRLTRLGNALKNPAMVVVISTCSNVGIHVLPRVLPGMCATCATATALPIIVGGSLAGGAVGAIVTISVPPAATATKNGIERLLKRK